MNTRLLSTTLDEESCQEWQDVPMIVYTNAIKDAINVEVTMAFAKRTSQQVHCYYAIDTYCGKPIQDDVITDLLDTLPSNKTGGRIGALP